MFNKCIIKVQEFERGEKKTETQKGGDDIKLVVRTVYCCSMCTCYRRNRWLDEGRSEQVAGQWVRFWPFSCRARKPSSYSSQRGTHAIRESVELIRVVNTTASRRLLSMPTTLLENHRGDTSSYLWCTVQPWSDRRLPGVAFVNRSGHRYVVGAETTKFRRWDGA